MKRVMRAVQDSQPGVLGSITAFGSWEWHWSASVPVYVMRAIGERENGDRLSVSRVLSAEDWELAQFDIVGVTARGMLDKLKDALSSR